MNKNILWKLFFIFLLAAFAAWQVYPPKDKLKLGLDLAGGTSLIYEIDTTGLKPQERKGLAASLIPTLLKRIDPTHVANIVMRPQGDTRIEIQLPLSSAETRQKRQAYETALLELEETNINLLQIKQTLSLEPAQRAEKLAAFAGGNEQRTQILQTLAEVYDLRTAKQQQRDQASPQMDQIANELAQAGVDKERLLTSVHTWTAQSPAEQAKSIEAFVTRQIPSQTPAETGNEKPLTEAQQAAVEQIRRYLDAYNRWSDAVNELTAPETGLNARWNEAYARLDQINLNIDGLQGILDLPKDSAKRSEALAALKEAFPQRADLIDRVTAAFDAYRVVGGQLDDPEDLKRMLKGAGVLEFRILPTQADSSLTSDEINAYLNDLRTKGPKQASDTRYIWAEIEDPQNWPGQGITGSFGDKLYVLASNQSGETMLQSGNKQWKLKRAFPDMDRNGQRAIGFAFDQSGATTFYGITSKNIGKPLAILLDDLVISAPNIQSAIGASGIITGNFTPTEQSDMVNKLNAGSFRAKLSDVPISEKTIGATIGGDNLEKGIRAGLIGFAAVAGFMLIYYWLAGAIADVALMLNMLFILAIMSFLSATFTLPGIAGLILTIGMSVDANVLIFERIREEQKRGSSLRAAIAAGYSRALSTILDSNITTFGVAAILLMVASEEIKGFAIVLMLGIISSMFTALLVTRVIFDLLVGRRIITNHLRMFGVLQNVRVDWMGLRPLCLTLSAVMVIGGLTVFFTRNETTNSKYDIEFTGGTSAIIEFKAGTGLTREKVEDMFRKHAEAIGNRPMQAARVNAIVDSENQFEITTTETNKTTAEVRLPGSANPTVQSVTDAILNAADEMGQSMSGLSVTATGERRFKVSTSRVNKALVEEVLRKALGEEAVIANVEVDEVVSDAIRNTFEGLLNVQQSLNPQIASVEKVPATAPELAEYVGGIKLLVKLESEAPVRALRERIDAIRWKPDMQGLKWYRYELLRTDLIAPQPDEMLGEFVYVSVHPEAGYRDLSESEWNIYVQNEETKVASALTMESSLARVTQIDPSVGQQAKVRALLAIFLSLIAIVGYIWVRFGTARYGFAAILALVHDVCITLGLVTACTYIANTPLGNLLGVQDFKINLEMIAAFLAIIGYSLNDTIVVFDRIRENRGKLSTLTPKLINDSINQTLSRTILTSFTTFLVIVIMYLWGGLGLRGFTFAMGAGVLIGTYSSIAIAAPLLLLGEKRASRKQAA